jgi:hypothetical protein
VLRGLFEPAWHGTVREMLPVVGEGLPLDTLLGRLSAMRVHATSDNPVVDLTAVADEIRTRYAHDTEV